MFSLLGKWYSNLLLVLLKTHLFGIFLMFSKCKLPSTFILALYLEISPVDGFLFLFICHTLDNKMAPSGNSSFLINL